MYATATSTKKRPFRIITFLSVEISINLPISLKESSIIKKYSFNVKFRNNNIQAINIFALLIRTNK